MFRILPSGNRSGGERDRRLDSGGELELDCSSIIIRERKTQETLIGENWKFLTEGIFPIGGNFEK
jgi:hypothetical protein